jgi:hypothetical protein
VTPRKLATALRYALEVIAGRVVRLNAQARTSADAFELTQAPAALSDERHRDTSVARPREPIPVGLAEAEMAPSGPVVRTVTTQGQEKDSDMKAFWSPTITVRQAHNATEAEQLLPLPVLGRLCSHPSMSNARQRDVYLSQIIVALDGDSTLGFAAYKPTAGSIRVAHEFWVDPHARCGRAPVTQALLTALEAATRAAGCSRLFVVVAQSTPLRPILENSGYGVHLAGVERSWFEKRFVCDSDPLESA